MAHDNKGVSKEEAIRRGLGSLPVQLEEPAAARAEAKAAKQPAQASGSGGPGSKRPDAREDVPPPGNMGPPEGPGS